jgi:hypothetical protein
VVEGISAFCCGAYKLIFVSWLYKFICVFKHFETLHKMSSYGLDNSVFQPTRNCVCGISSFSTTFVPTNWYCVWYYSKVRLESKGNTKYSKSFSFVFSGRPEYCQANIASFHIFPIYFSLTFLICNYKFRLMTALLNNLICQ